MRRRSRTRWVLKWMGMAVSIVILLACVGTQLAGIEYYTPSKKRHFAVTNGAFILKQVGGGGWWDHRGSRLFICWGLYFPYHWRPHLYMAGTGPLTDRDVELVIPLWMLTGLVAIPTAVIWWRDRRFPRGHCRVCGYNLTGNISAICPECGTAIKRGGEAR